MPERNGRVFAQAYVELLRTGDFERLSEFLQPDCVHEYPQSGERFVGIDNIRAVLENYPGGLGQQDMASLRVAHKDGSWAMAPNFTLVEVSGGGDTFTSAVKARYPDGTDWYVISMVELTDGLMARATMFFGPLFDAPDWRKPFAEPRQGVESRS